MKDETLPAPSLWLAKKGRENRSQEKKKAETLIVAALNIARKPSGRAELRAGQAALKAAFGQGFRVKRDDVLKLLLASAVAIFFSEN